MFDLRYRRHYDNRLKQIEDAVSRRLIGMTSRRGLRAVLFGIFGGFLIGYDYEIALHIFSVAPVYVIVVAILALLIIALAIYDGRNAGG